MTNPTAIAPVPSTATAAPIGTSDDADFWAEAGRHVLRYTSSFSPVIVERAAGSVLHLNDGREVLDFTSGQMSAILGHSHPAITAIVRTASENLSHLFSGMLSRPVVELSRRLAESLPDPLERVLLLSTGAESNEAALRLAKLVTGKHEVVSFSRSWHGMTLGVANATYSTPRRGYGPSVPGNFAIPTPYGYRPDFTDAHGQLDWQEQLEFSFAQIDQESCGSLAACIVEPILSSGGVIVPPRGYLAALQRKCHERGMLLILDEAQTALCRTGAMYAFEAEGFVPDVLTLSKTLGAGLPVAAVITSAEIEQRGHELGYLFFTTHVSDPLAAAVGNTVLDVLEREEMAAQVRVKGAQLAGGLNELKMRHAVIGDVRGRGLMLGLEFVLDPETKAAAPELGAAVTARCLDLGLHVNVVQLGGDLGGTLRLAPALTTTPAQLAQGLEILDQAIGEAARAFV
ncbi:MAG: aspartate aminotransferase family protein [Solirubrobacterales bacterium]